MLPRRVRRLSSLLEVRGGGQAALGVVVEQADPAIAALTEQATHDATVVIVVDDQREVSAADRAAPTLTLEQQLVISHRHPVSVTAPLIPVERTRAASAL
jgi:hypothetical protein